MRKLEFDLEAATDDLARLTSGKIEGQEAQIAEANAARKAAEEALKKMENVLVSSICCLKTWML